MTPPVVPGPTPQRLVGGVVAFDDDDRVGDALDSLVHQELPPGVRMDRIWVVAGGNTSRTLDVAREWEARDPRIRVIEEPTRRGKSAALAEICAVAQGDLLVLLNGDARARPGAVSAMIEAARDAEAPFGVMARPVIDGDRAGPIGGPLTLLWELHHSLHAELAHRGDLDHLSDELMLLPTAALPPFTEGIVNDGTFVALWVRAQGGRLLYAEGASVEVSPPHRLSDHVRQRRRIRRGHHTLGTRPTWTTFAMREPRRAFQMLRDLTHQPRAGRALAILLMAETAAIALGGWDLVRGRDFALWPRIQAGPLGPADGPRSHVAGR